MGHCSRSQETQRGTGKRETRKEELAIHATADWSQWATTAQSRWGLFSGNRLPKTWKAVLLPWIVPPSVEGLLQGLAPPYPGLCGQRLGTVRVSPRANTADMFNGSKAGCCQATPACSWQSGQEPGHGDGLTRVLGWLQAHSGFLGLWSQQPLMLPS